MRKQEVVQVTNLHIVVVDEDGGISGTKGDVLETYDAVSKGSDAKTPQGDVTTIQM